MPNVLGLARQRRARLRRRASGAAPKAAPRVRLDGVALCDLGALPVLLQLGYAQQEPRGCLRWTAGLLRWLGGRACPGGGRPGGRAACDGETGGVRWPRAGTAGGVRRSGRGGDRSALPGPWGAWAT